MFASRTRSVPTCTIRGLWRAAFAAARSSQHPFQCWTSVSTTVLTCGHFISFAIAVPAAVISVITRSNFYVLVFFRFFWSPFIAFAVSRNFYHTAPHRRVFLLPLPQYLLARFHSTPHSCTRWNQGWRTRVYRFVRAQSWSRCAITRGRTFGDHPLKRPPPFRTLSMFYYRCPYITRAWIRFRPPISVALVRHLSCSVARATRRFFLSSFISLTDLFMSLFQSVLSKLSRSSY